MIRELDNFPVAGLRRLLNTDTTLARYYPLIPVKEELIEALEGCGVHDKYAYLALSDVELAQITGLDGKTATMLRSFFHLHDFIDRKLREVTGVDPGFIEALAARGIKTSAAYFELYRSAKRCGEALGESAPTARRLLCLCDLMRLPGVKSVRANLYYDCGLHTLCDFAGKDARSLRALIGRMIAENGRPESVPLPKELSTQAAVASVLPKLAL